MGLVRRQDSPTRQELVDRERRRREWIREKKNKMIARDLTGRANGTIDPYYGCYLSLEIQDYALNFSMPWSEPKFTFFFFQLHSDFFPTCRSHPADCHQQFRCLRPLQCTPYRLSASSYNGTDRFLKVYNIPDARSPPLALDPTAFFNGTSISSLKMRLILVSHS